MSAGTFIIACMKKPTPDLARANIASAARQHEIPEDWARFYVAEELNRSNRGK